MNLIAEIGINHNGDIEICKSLIFCAKQSGFNYVKIQKRNPDKCVPEEQKSKMRETPWGTMTYLEYKKKIEFNEEQIKELLKYANEINITMFASVWDPDSVDLMAKHTKIGKIPSALITDLELCAYARSKFDTLIVSTGMSTEDEIEKCILSCSPNVVMHSNSTYPCPPEDLNLRYITWLKDKYSDREIGYSGHESGIIPTLATVPLGVTWIERHVTMDKTMWGSDQKASLDIQEMFELVKNIKIIEKSCQYIPQERIQFETENIKKKSLRK
jgi:N-acetylneuraminate synthase|tara:strand:+ start:1501 stop:2316 length:816 start_codon:yes stop_codon:yes gene_type:complete